MSGSPDWLLFLLLFSLKATHVAQDRHVVDTDGLSVPQQAEGFTAEHHPAQLVPPLGHTGGTGMSMTWWKTDTFVFCPWCTTPWALSVLFQIPYCLISLKKKKTWYECTYCKLLWTSDFNVVALSLEFHNRVNCWKEKNECNKTHISHLTDWKKARQ